MQELMNLSGRLAGHLAGIWGVERTPTEVCTMLVMSNHGIAGAKEQARHLLSGDASMAEFIASLSPFLQGK